MVSLSLLLRDEWYLIVAATGAVVEALLGFPKELNFWRLLVPAWPEERAMIFLQCAPLIHHAGHRSFWGHRPVRLAVAPRMPRSLAWSTVLGVMALRSTGAEGRDVHPFTGLRRGRRDLSPGASGGVGAGRVLESTGSRVRAHDAAVRPALGLGWQLDAERRCS